MAQEGAAHKTMCEAFAKRLQQLYPEPPAAYSRGRKISMGLKPDVYVCHPSGSRWAFEMVHGNSQATHLLDNHRRYQAAEIQDVWILWDDLRPRLGSDLSPNQGVILSMFPDKFLLPERKLTAPQKAILAMQPAETKFLYAFSISPVVEGLGVQLLDTMSIGVFIYAFQPVGQPGAYSVTKRFVPMTELVFGPDGNLKEPETPAFREQDLPDLLRALGYDATQAVIPAEVFHRIADLMRTQEGLQSLIELFLMRRLELLDPETLAQMVALAAEKVTFDVTPYQGMLSIETQSQVYNDPSAMHAMAADAQAAKIHIEGLTIPTPLKQFLLGLLDPSMMANNAAWMQWQAENPSLQKAREQE